VLLAAARREQQAAKYGDRNAATHQFVSILEA
jgi:hypothetical protein